MLSQYLEDEIIHLIQGFRVLVKLVTEVGEKELKD